MTLSVSNILSQTCYKLTKTHAKTLVFTTLDILQLKIDDCKNIYSVNPLYLLVNHVSGYIKEKNENKYLIFDSTDENKELLKRYAYVWDEIKKTKSKQ